MSSESEMDMNKKSHDHHHYNYAGGLLWFFIIWIFVVLILWATKPDFVVKKHKGYGKDDKEDEHHGKKKHCEVDLGRAVLWGFIIALILCLIFCVFLYVCRGNDQMPNGRHGRRWGY